MDTTQTRIDTGFATLRATLESVVPDSRERSIALTQLDTARLWAQEAYRASKGLTLETPPGQVKK
jgi:hypothetical protein